MKKHPDRKLIDTEYVAELILGLINQPEYVNINEISVDPIQTGDYARELKYLLKIKNITIRNFIVLIMSLKPYRLKMTILHLYGITT